MKHNPDKAEKTVKQNTCLGDTSYMEDVEFDETTAIVSTYICWSEVSHEKALQEYTRLFNKTEDEIKQIIAEYERKQF